ncbi:DUF4401 domain-containing protein [Shewanella khirikhana]|uniref:DUF4401 domain-containing protein n=1 Tax=Shewanella khirikhana TaxID=1965282 RepID=A0ABM7D1L6_9GAMM|nr:DUF4401 domain-containing protein [Shewanella khirikhana]AZQ10252.1 hypothetical protein STH12_01116 [Shewanella khirikhana]
MSHPLWRHLHAAGLMGDEPDNHTQPLWLTLLTGFAGWIAALFFLAFSIALIESISRFEGSQALVIGLIYTGLARFIYSQAGKLEFLVQLGFAINMAAMIAVVWGIGEAFDIDDAPLFVTGAAVLIINAWFARYWLDAQLSLFTALTLIGAAFEEAQLLGWFLPMLLVLLGGLSGLWLPRSDTGTPHAAGQDNRPWQLAVHPFARRCQHALFTGVLLLPLLLDSRLALWDSALFIAGASRGQQALVIVDMFIFSALIGGLLYQLLGKTLKALAFTLALTLLYWYFPGLAVALGCWVLGWRLAERYYVLLSLLAVLGYFSAYYYEMSMTLLAKSLVLMLLGGVLIAMGLYCKRRADA